MIGFPAPPRQIDRTASLVALLRVATVTEAMFLLLPSFVGALGDVLHLSATRTGLLASADLTGIALTTATAPWWLRRVSWRRTVLASLLAFLLVNLLCFAVRSFWPLLCLRVLAGLSVGARWYPDDPGDRPPAGQIAWRVVAGRGTLVVAGTGLYFLMIGAVWSYLEGIARAAGLSLKQTGTALSGGSSWGAPILTR